MTSLALATVLQASVLAAATTDGYSDARHETVETGRPMVILVGADWCPACVDMKKKIMPKVKKRGLLRKVAYAFVNLDRQPKLGRQLITGGHIPQMIMYRKTDNGWRRRKLVGGHDVKTVETFIKQGIELNETAKKAKPKPERSA